MSRTAPVVIGGCGSSGTTLLRQMLNRHPAIFCGPESNVFLARQMSPAEMSRKFGFDAAEIKAWRQDSRFQAEFIDKFQAACLDRSGKSHWIDKTPENVRRLAFIGKHFPHAKFVHVIRDGRDTACSLRHRSWLKLNDRTSPDALRRCAAYWVERVSAGLKMRGRPNYYEVRYEDLVFDPENTLRGLLHFIGVEWDGHIVEADVHAAEKTNGPLFQSSVGRWRKDLSDAEMESIKPICGNLLDTLRYEEGAEWASASAARQESFLQNRKLFRFPKRFNRFERLLIEIKTAWGLIGDIRLPWYSRVLSLVPLAYYWCPLDLIPNKIPIVGHVDGMMMVPLSLLLATISAPGKIVRDHRRATTSRLTADLAPKAR